VSVQPYDPNTAGVEVEPRFQELPKSAVRVERLSRQDFLETAWSYEAGEHVTIIGPTGSGKTWLGYQLLEHAATPELPAIVLVMKPRDSTVTKWSKKVGYRIVRNWPPPVSPWKPKKPPGFVVWPKHSFDPDRDEQTLHTIFRRAILDAYKKGDRILFGDEVYSLAVELGLTKELITIWSKGRSMGCGLWTATQKPTHVPLWAYSQAEHLFLAFDPDKRARDRFKEIGGVDPIITEQIVMSLGKHEWLYIRREDAAMCIVEAYLRSRHRPVGNSQGG
jgi:hypothetical protein